MSLQAKNRVLKKKVRRRISKLKAGLPPGVPVYTGQAHDVESRVTIIDFNADTFSEVEALEKSMTQDDNTVTWIDVTGLHETQQVKRICDKLNIHPLWVEDILNPLGRAKFETIDSQAYFRVRTISIDERGLNSQSVNLVVGEGWVATFHEAIPTMWDPLKKRIKSGGGRIRKMKSDYLLHALLDNVVDRYFTTIEEIDLKIDLLEASAIDKNVSIELSAVFELKNQLSDFRRMVWPIREATNALIRDEVAVMSSAVSVYFRDLYDHVVQVMDMLDTSRERLVGVYELQLAVNGAKLNDIMKVLTIVSTIFIPMTFIAGVYGMNFKNMPELEWQYGYGYALVLMLCCALGGGLWVSFRKWL